MNIEIDEMVAAIQATDGTITAEQARKYLEKVANTAILAALDKIENGTIPAYEIKNPGTIIVVVG